MRRGGRAGRQPAASCGPPGRWPSPRWSPGSPGCSARWCWPPRSASALVNDAYNTANTLPNIVYELLLGGVLTSVVVPLLVHAQERDRDGGVGLRPAAGDDRHRRPGRGHRRWPILAAPLLTSLYGITDDPEQVRAGQLAGPDPAGRDRLLRRRRPGPGDPELAAASSARRRGRRCSTTSSSSPPALLFIAASGPGELEPGDDHARPGLAARHRHARSASPSRPLVLLPLLRQGRRAAAAAVGPEEHRPARGGHARPLGHRLRRGQPGRRHRGHPDRQRRRPRGRPGLQRLRATRACCSRCPTGSSASRC